MEMLKYLFLPVIAYILTRYKPHGIKLNRYSNTVFFFFFSFSSYLHVFKVKVKQSHYWLGEALRVSGGLDSQISRQSEHEGGKVVSPTHRPPLPPGSIPGTHFC